MTKKFSEYDRVNQWDLPVIVDPGRIKVCFDIPYERYHIRAFWTALYKLTLWNSWAADDNHTGRQVALVWREVLNQAMADPNTIGCGDEINCATFEPNAPFIEWFPNNPYTEPDLIGEGYNAPAWYEATEASNLILGTQFGDVVTDISRFPPGSLPSIIPASGLPRFRINLGAPGIITIHLLNIFAGSIAQITIDDNPLTVRFIDMDRDQIAIPFETATTTPVEVEVLGEGTHHIDVIVVSQINDSIPFLHHGGGLRKVEVCGEAADMPFYELRTNPDNPCLIEQRQSPTGEWFEAFRMDNCCDETVYTRYNSDGIMETSTDGETWEENRADDPRFYPPTLPPLVGEPGDLLRCEAANNVTGYLHSTADQTIADSAAWGNLSALLGVLMSVILVIIAGASLGTLSPLALGLIGALMATGSSAFAAAMTTEVYETFLCIVYCNTPDDGLYTEENWQAIKAQTITDITGIAGTFFSENLNIMGIAGMNNAARTGISEGLDCDECECNDVWCYLFDFSVNNGEWTKETFFGDNNGVYQAASGWRFTDAVNTNTTPDSANRLVYIDRTFDISTLTKVTVTYDYVGGTYDSNARQALSIGLNAASAIAKTRAMMTDGNGQEFVWEGLQGGITNVSVYLRASIDIASPYVYSGDARITSVKLEGNGANPFGADNCP